MSINERGEIRPETATPSVEAFYGDFRGKDVVSVDQFTQPEEIHLLLEAGDEMRRSVDNREIRTDLMGSSVALLFYQPSTRTYTSFLAAAQRLGATYSTPVHGMEAYSSAVKGESLTDTIRTIEQTTAADVIILRHPDDDSSEIAAEAAEIPIINAGSGRKEHPTQAILDLYTIRQELGKMDDLTITMTGDLRNGRTIKSLAKLIMVAGNNISFNFVSPEVLSMPDEITQELRDKGARVVELENGSLREVMPDTDVLYVTRVQDEWFKIQAMEDIRKQLGRRYKDLKDSELEKIAARQGKREYEKAVDGYRVDAELMSLAKKKMIVMHPLPRVGEISKEVDEDPRAAYFRQMGYGLFTRMALLSEVLK